VTAYSLGVTCCRCGAAPGQRCLSASGRVTATHTPRARLAVALAAHADPALAAFPELGPLTPCGLCGVPGMPQRHRVVDAMADMLEAGEDPEAVAFEYRVPLPAVEAVQLWMKRWPGAWT
jgi:hypothetical protein